MGQKAAVPFESPFMISYYLSTQTLGQVFTVSPYAIQCQVLGHNKLKRAFCGVSVGTWVRGGGAKTAHFRMEIPRSDSTIYNHRSFASFNHNATGERAIQIGRLQHGLSMLWHNMPAANIVKSADDRPPGG